MISIILTIDYELFGNGSGNLKQHVVEPAFKLLELLDKYGFPMVNFVEAAELLMISKSKTNQEIYLVENQLKQIYQSGHEIGLHIHPQWFNAKYENNFWSLDNDEYNLCLLSQEKIRNYIFSGIEYLKMALEEPAFNPISYRAGNWLIQPTAGIYEILVEAGIKIDSSVFKGGFQKKRGLDFRNSLKNPSYWRFKSNVNIPDSSGNIIEIPIYSEMKPIWKLITNKRIETFQKMEPHNHKNESFFLKLYNYFRMFRFLYPIKFDISKQSSIEMIRMIESVKNNSSNSDKLNPIVSIGHTKNLNDFKSLDTFFRFLQVNEIEVITFKTFYDRIKDEQQY